MKHPRFSRLLPAAAPIGGSLSVAGKAALVLDVDAQGQVVATARFSA